LRQWWHDLGLADWLRDVLGPKQVPLSVQEREELIGRIARLRQELDQLERRLRDSEGTEAQPRAVEIAAGGQASEPAGTDSPAA
jgi:hypothetical protein